MKRLGLGFLLVLLMASALFAFDGYVDITNETGFTIYYVYVSHESDEFWGDDMLGDDYLESGDTYRVYLSGHSTSIFDIMLEDEDGDTYTFETVDVEQDDVLVTLDDLDAGGGSYSGEATINGPGGDFDGYVDVSNTTGFTMYYIKIRQNSKTWGPDLLGDDVLQDGDSFTINLNNFPSTVFDIRLEDDEGDTYSFYDVDVQSDDVMATLDHLD
jgi:hypothetical protein